MPGPGRARLSRMMVGNVEFGRRYGIANQASERDFHEFVALLEEKVSGNS